MRGEKKTTHLGGVHVTPGELIAIKKEAASMSMTLSRYVRQRLGLRETEVEK